MRKLAIIGASYLQEPLIEKAKDNGIETHVFAWKANDVGEKCADFFYPISIIEKEAILNKCREIGIDGICSIASDLAVGTVNYVAVNMGLIGNSMESSAISTNKHLMKKAFYNAAIPTPVSIQVESIDDIDVTSLKYPIVVKPVDRSGSRGITELFSKQGLKDSIERAIDYGFIKKALVEEFAEGQEYSVECITWKGEHRLLAITKKFTTGTPHFIEMGHIEPSGLDSETSFRIKEIVFRALDSMMIEYGASHSEIKIDYLGNIKVIEIGARGGGDCICSNLVELSTGIDFVKAVIDIALGNEPIIQKRYNKSSAIRYIMGKSDLDDYSQLFDSRPDVIVESHIGRDLENDVFDSSSRHGYFIMRADTIDELTPYMPYALK